MGRVVYHNQGEVRAISHVTELCYASMKAEREYERKSKH